MDEFVTDLNNALKGVHRDYVQYRNIKGLQEGVDITNQDFFRHDLSQDYVDRSLLTFLEEQKETQEKSLEAVFCYELYHSWKKLIHSQAGRYKDLILNGEIGKMNLAKVIANYEQFKNSSLYREIEPLGLLEQGHFFPDFTLHGGNNDTQNQKLIVEVKTNENITADNFKIDFYRLSIFKQLYGFENVAFIIINIKIKDLLDLLENVNIELVDKEHFYFMLKTMEDNYCFKLGDIK